MDEKLITKNKPYVPFYTELIIFFTFLTFLSLSIAISTIIRLDQFGTKKCFSATTSSQQEQQIQPQEMSYLGLTNGMLEINKYSIYWKIEYFLPPSEGIIERIIIKGPFDNFGIGVDSYINTVALTICGGEISCSDMEILTCHNNNLPSNCGIISGMRYSLDISTPDIPINANDGGGTDDDITDLIQKLKNHSSLFYISIETTNHPTGAQRANINSICTT